MSDQPGPDYPERVEPDAQSNLEGVVQDLQLRLQQVETYLEHQLPKDYVPSTRTVDVTE